MKFLISESKLAQIVSKYLDNQDFIKIEQGDKIYLINSKGDEFAQIGYDIKKEWCYIHYKLVEEICSFFSLEESDSERLIAKWVENTLQMKISSIVPFSDDSDLIV